MKRAALAVACITLTACQSLSGGTQGKVYAREAREWKPDGTYRHEVEHGIKQRSNAGVFGGKLTEPLQEASVDVLDDGTVALVHEQMFISGDNAEQARMAEKMAEELTPVLLKWLETWFKSKGLGL